MDITKLERQKMGDAGEAWKATKDIRKEYSVEKRLRNYQRGINKLIKEIKKIEQRIEK